MIMRLAWSVVRDLRIQSRSGYPWITALLALAGILLFARIPQGNSDRTAPFASLAFSLLTTLPFLIRQVNGERREGSFDFLDTSPLRPHEYLASKAISLAFPSIAMNTVMVLVSRGPYFNPGFFWAGLALSGFSSVCAGFLIASRFRNAAGAWALSAIVGSGLLLPFLPGHDLPPRAILRLHPWAGPASLVAGSYQDTTIPAAGLDAALGLCWLLVALAACRKAFARMRVPGGD